MSEFGHGWEKLALWQRNPATGLCRAIFAHGEFEPTAAEVSVLERGQTVTRDGWHYRELYGALHRKRVEARGFAPASGLRR